MPEATEQQPTAPTPSDILTEEDVNQIFEEIEKRISAARRRLENPYVLHLIKVLWGHGARGSRRDLLMERVFELRKTSGVNMPRKKFENAVQSTFNRHNSQSEIFKKLKRSPDRHCRHCTPVRG
jgi:hypothetical protein